MSLRNRKYLYEGDNKKPTKSQVQGLVKAYAVMIAAKKGAPFKVEQSKHNAFYRKYNSMMEKYPYVDMTSDEFWSGMKRAAEKYSHGRSIGPGTAW